LGPLSEVYGRRPLLITSNLVFIAFNIGCSEAQTFSQMVGFRFLSGLGGSGPLSIGGGVLGDLWMAEQRGKAAALYSLGPLLGPSIGPVAGGLIADNISWRWTFRIVTIVAAISAILGAILLPETYAPVLLRRKVQRIRMETGNPTLETIYGKDKTIQQRISTALIRPFILLFTQPIVIVLTLFQSCLYGTFYIILVTLTRSYQQVYHQSTTIASLHYLATGLGFIFGGCPRYYCVISTDILTPYPSLS
jgi:multidrug resistance protein